MQISLRSSAGLLALFFFAVLAVVPASYAGPLDTLEPGHWYEFPDSRLEDLDPCPQGNCPWSGNLGQFCVAEAWNGAAFDSVRNRLIAWGGGHNCYAGNEVYVFDVLGTGRWQRLTEPSSNVNCNFSTGEYPDDRPCSAHTYDYVDFHPSSNSFVLLGSASLYPQGGSGAATVHLFSFDTNTWRRGANRPGDPSYEGASSAYDPTRDAFWVLPAFSQRFAKYDPNASGGQGQWTMHQQAQITIDAASAIDPTRDLFVTVDGRGTNNVIVRDLANPNSGPVTVSTAGDTSPESSAKLGFEWDSASRKFVAWTGGASVYTLTPPSGNWRRGTWNWVRMAPAPTNAVVPTSPNSNGTYSKFRYMPSVNAFIVYNRTSDNVFAYKLSQNPANPPPTVSFSADVNPVPINGSTTLNWTSSNATSCSGTGGLTGWAGTKPLQGSETVGPFVAAATFGLPCTGAGGTIQRSLTINLVGAPTVNFSANPTNVTAGSHSTLTWSSTNATTCSASGGWAGTKNTSGNEQSPIINVTTNFGLGCTGSGGTASASTTVNVTPGGGSGGGGGEETSSDSGGGALGLEFLFLLGSLAATLGPRRRNHNACVA